MEDERGELQSQSGFEEADEASSVVGSNRRPVRFDLTKVCTCCLCGATSTSQSPLSTSHEGDEWGGRRSWAKYRPVTKEEVAYRVPEGKLCLICSNVYHLLGLKHKWGSYKQYCEKCLKQKQGDHAPFMAALAKWIADHNANPERRRVVDPKAVQKAQVKIKSKTNVGVRVKQNREFVTREDWDEAKDGVWDESKVSELEIAGKTVKGIFKKAPGRYKVEEYVDAANQESRVEEDSSRTPFAEEALNNAREASNNSWQEARAARDAASVEGQKKTDLGDVLKLLEGVAGGVTLAERGGGAAAAGSAAAAEAVVKAEPLEEEQESSAEEDAGVSSASRLAARFGAPKAKAALQTAATKAKAKSTPKAKAAAAPAAAASRSEKPGPPEAKPKAASRVEGPALRPVKEEKTDLSPEPTALLVLDGRGERLKLSLRKQLDDIIRDLETTTLAQLDDPKERKRRAKVLTQAIASLKSQTKRLQESANRAALQEEEDELSEMSDVATAAHTVFSAANCANPDSEQLTKACALLRASRLNFKVDSSIYARAISAKAAQSCLFRQYSDMCARYNVKDSEHGREISQLQHAWPKAQVQAWAMTDLSNRLSTMLRNIPINEVGKVASDAKEQFGLLCKAMEGSSSENELVQRVLSQVRLAHALVFPAQDLEACRQALVRVDDFAAKLAEGESCEDATEEEARAMLQFFVEHRLGVTFTAAAREQVQSGEGERVMQQKLQEVNTLVHGLKQVADVTVGLVRNHLEPIWLKLLEAKEKATKATHRVELEQQAKQLLDWLLLKTTTESQEEVLGFLDYVTHALSDNGMARPLDSEPDAQPALLDFAAAVRELNHTQSVLEPFFEKLTEAKQRPKQLDERLQKETFVRGHLRAFAAYVFQKKVPGLCPDAGTPSADEMTFWTSDLPVALGELLPDQEDSLQTQQAFFQAFSPTVLTELQMVALQAYHEVGDFVELVVSGKSNESVAAAVVDKLTMEMPKDCQLRPAWAAFFRVAAMNHELRTRVSADFGTHLKRSRELKQALQTHEAALQSNPEKTAAMKLLTPQCQRWLEATIEFIPPVAQTIARRAGRECEKGRVGRCACSTENYRIRRLMRQVIGQRCRRTPRRGRVPRRRRGALRMP